MGYGDFRSDKVQEPLKDDVFWSAPTLFTLNPLGAPVTHAGMHVTAVLHSYDTDVMASATPLGRDHRRAGSLTSGEPASACAGCAFSVGLRLS